MISFLYFLLSTSFKTSWWVFINPVDKKESTSEGLVTEIKKLSIQYKCAIILPWFIETAGQSFSPDFVSLDKNPHARVDVQNSSIGPEGPLLRLPVREEGAPSFKENSSQHFQKYRHKVTIALTLLQQASQPSVCLGDLSLHPALVLWCPSASDYRRSQECLEIKHPNATSQSISTMSFPKAKDSMKSEIYWHNRNNVNDNWILSIALKRCFE